MDLKVRRRCHLVFTSPFTYIGPPSEASRLNINPQHNP